MKKLYLISFVAIVSLAFAAPNETFAATFAGVSLSPAVQSDENDLRTRSWFIYNLDAGVVYEDKVLIANDSGEEKKLKLCAADGYETEQGGFALRKCTDKQEHVGAWIKLEQETISLKSGESKLVSFKYKVPESILPGEYTGGIAAEDEAKNLGNGIALVNRVGVRLYHTVPGGQLVISGKQSAEEPASKEMHPSATTTTSAPVLLMVVIAIFSVIFVTAIPFIFKFFKNKKSCLHAHKKH